MKSLILSIVFLSLCLVSTAQNTPAPGLLWNDSLYLLLPVYPADMRSVTLEQADLRAYCPEAGDQAGQHSCLGFALCNTMTMLWAQKNKKTNTTDSAWIADNTFSAAFIYNQTKAGKACTSGSFIDVALQLVQTKGACLRKSFPYDSLDCSRQPNARQLKEAMHFRIDSLQRFPLPASSDSMLHWTLHALSADHPVLAGLKLHPTFTAWAKIRTAGSPSRRVAVATAMPWWS